jgi:hypothetical protein
MESTKLDPVEPEQKSPVEVLPEVKEEVEIATLSEGKNKYLSFPLPDKLVLMHLLKRACLLTHDHYSWAPILVFYPNYEDSSLAMHKLLRQFTD